MSRPLAGYIGYDAEPTTDAAPGIWTLREAEFYKRKAQWPVPSETYRITTETGEPLQTQTGEYLARHLGPVPSETYRITTETGEPLQTQTGEYLARHLGPVPSETYRITTETGEPLRTQTGEYLARHLGPVPSETYRITTETGEPLQTQTGEYLARHLGPVPSETYRITTETGEPLQTQTGEYLARHLGPVPSETYRITTETGEPLQTQTGEYLARHLGPVPSETYRITTETGEPLRTQTGEYLARHLVGSTWTQVGADIDGEAASDRSGYSVALSSDGSRVAIGAIYNDGGGGDSGHVRVYDLVGSTWTQVGADIDGEAAGDLSGYSVALSSDGSRVAIGAYSNDGGGNDSGHVRVYDLVGSTWTQVGADIDGEAAGDLSGYSVALSSDGSRVAIGAIFNDGGGSSSGHVRVYDLVGSTWTQVGADIDGEAASDLSGYSVALSSDGSRVAIGAVFNDGVGGSNSGHVRVYDLVGSTWTQVGADIDGEAVGDQSGYSVALSSNGSRVAIGAVGNDGGGSNPSHVRVYDLVGSTWTQVGADIDGEAAGDQSGVSVALSSNGSRVAIGAIFNDGVGGSNSGHVRVYDLVGSTWTQVGADIDGEAAGDQSGVSVALSSNGSRVAIGAIFNDGVGGSNSGHVRVYDLGPVPSETYRITTETGEPLRTQTGEYLARHLGPVPFAPVPFAPDDLTGLQLWLDASDASTLYDATSGGSLVGADGGVARWEDKSGNDRHATQGTAGNRPARKTAIQGGLDVLRFDGSDDELSVPNSTATFKFMHSTQATVFLVSKPDPSVDNAKFLGAIGTYDTASANIGYALAYDDRAPLGREDEIRVLVGRGIQGTLVVSTPGTGNAPFSAGSFSVVAITTDCTAASGNDRVSILINKAVQGVTNSNTNPASTSNSTYDLHIGILPDLFPWEGDIAEVIIYDSALNDTDRGKVEDYLLAKWGIT